MGSVMDKSLRYKYRLKLHRMLENLLGFQALKLSKHGNRDDV